MTQAGFDDIGLRAKIQGAGQFITDAEKINASMRTMTGQIANTAKTSTTFGSAITGGFASAGRAVGGLVSAFAQLGFALFALQQVKTAVQGLVGTLTDAAAAWESYSVTFKVLTGSADLAQKKLEELEAFARKTPFTLVTVVEASKQMLAYGFTLDEIIPKLTAVGDASAAMGAESFPRIIRALGQMRARTKVSAQEMLQLTEAGIPGWRMLADAIGVSVAELQDMVTKGLIPAEAAIEVLTAGMEKQFGGLMEEQSRTFAGMTSNLEDWVFRAKRMVQEPIFEGLKEQLAGLLVALDTEEMEANLKQLGITIGNAFQAVIETVRGLGDAWADMGERGQKNVLFLAALFVAKGPLIGGIRFTIAAVGALAAAFQRLPVVALGKWALLIAAVVASVTAIQKVALEINRGIASMATGIGFAIIESGLPGMDRLGKMAVNFGASLRDTAEMMSPWAVAMEEPQKAMRNIIGLGQEGVDIFGDLLTKAEDWTIEKVLDQFESLRARISDIPGLDKLGDTSKAIRSVQDTSAAVEVLKRAISSGAADSKAAIKGLEGNVKQLELALKEAEAAMRKFTDPRLTGMQTAENEMFELDMAIKRARLSELGLGDAGKEAAKVVQDSAQDMAGGFDDLAAQQREIAEGIPVPFQRAMDEIEKAQREAAAPQVEIKGIAASAADEIKESERLGRLREARQLIYDLTYEPQLRSLKETFEAMTGANQETTFITAKTNLIESIIAAARITAELNNQQAMLDTAKQAYEDQQAALSAQETSALNIGGIRSGQVATEDTITGRYETQTAELLKQYGIVENMKKLSETTRIYPEVSKPATQGQATSLEGYGDYPGFAAGGTVARGGMAMVGEVGPETLYLPPGARVLPSSGFSGKGDTTNNDTYNLYQQTQPYDVMDRIRRYQKLARMTQGR